MIYPIITAEEAAEFVKNGDTIGVSGFTIPGNAKKVPVAIAAKARREHEAGREFKVNLFSGASTNDYTDGELSRAHALNFRAPYQSLPEVRKRINADEVHYNDRHLSEMAQEIRYGFYGKMDVAIIEAQSITDDGEIVLGTAVGNSPTWLQCAEKVIIEVNDQIPESIHGLHDIYVPLDPPCRREIPIYKPSDRAGKPTAHVDPKKVVGVVKTSMPLGMPGGFTPLDDTTRKIGEHVCEFLLNEMKVGRIPKEFLPIQSGVGNIANAVLEGLETSTEIPAFQVYTEVMQDTFVKLLESGRCKFVSTCSLTLSHDTMMEFFDNIKFMHDKVLMRPAEISNHPEVIRRLGVISMNTAIEADIFGNINSSHVSGTKLMNGIGGSGDFTRNAYTSIFLCPSIKKDDCISTIVPMVSHCDHTVHSVDIIVTDQGVADLRGKDPMQCAHEIIEKAAHPVYRPLLREFVELSKGGHIRMNPNLALAFHSAFAATGDMRKTDYKHYQVD
ncbi:MAG: succinate CoA transferase [Bacteroidales bacterium]|nr:succinate CoA transferase [Candidatus Sodaliphilus aphodohippi]